MKDFEDEKPLARVDEESLLIEHLAGELPSECVRHRALRDSTAAFVKVQRRRDAWRKTRFAAAAVFIAAAGFLSGRLSVATAPPGIAQGPEQVAGPGRVSVPAELVDWLGAAQLFRQLGMHDRMARAVERAGRFIPADGITADGSTAQIGACSSAGHPATTDLAGVPGPHPSAQCLYPVLAQSFGD